MLTTVVAWSAGEIVGERYRLERLIGEGGMGIVWAAVHQVTRKPVALKALRSNYSADKAVLQRFLREARAACAVRHPNVVEIHDVIVADGLPVMVMDLLEGESLGQRLERERSIPLDELAKILVPVASAVGTAHAIGIVHRDLKPDNIFLSRTATGVEVKVLDFGIAKLTATDGDAASTAGLTGTGAMLGTPYYMAPEQIYGEKDIDSRVDIWAMGVILYECLAGVRPTQADSIGQILRIVTRDGVKPLRTVRPDLPEDVLDLVDRLLAAERAKRPGSMDEVSSVLLGHAQGTSLTTTSPRGQLTPSASRIANASDTLVQAPTIAATTPNPLSSTTAPVATTSAARPAVFAVGGVLAIAALGAGIFFATRPSRQAAAIAPGNEATSSAQATVPTTAVLPALTATAVETGASTASARASGTASAPRVASTGSTQKTAPQRSAAASAVAPIATATASATGRSRGGVVDTPPF